MKPPESEAVIARKAQLTTHPVADMACRWSDLYESQMALEICALARNHGGEWGERRDELSRLGSQIASKIRRLRQSARATASFDETASVTTCVIVRHNLFSAIALAASYVPALRAMRVPVTEALRQD
jgi:hypothetical protein